MIPYDRDRSLRTADQHPQLLDDGFSPPRSYHEPVEPSVPDAAALEQAVAGKSDF